MSGYERESWPAPVIWWEGLAVVNIDGFGVWVMGPGDHRPWLLDGTADVQKSPPKYRPNGVSRVEGTS